MSAHSSDTRQQSTAREVQDRHFWKVEGEKFESDEERESADKILSLEHRGRIQNNTRRTPSEKNRTGQDRTPGE